MPQKKKKSEKSFTKYCYNSFAFFLYICNFSSLIHERSYQQYSTTSRQIGVVKLVRAWLVVRYVSTREVHVMFVLFCWWFESPFFHRNSFRNTFIQPFLHNKIIYIFLPSHLLLLCSYFYIIHYLTQIRRNVSSLYTGHLWVGVAAYRCRSI